MKIRSLLLTTLLAAFTLTACNTASTTPTPEAPTEPKPVIPAHIEDQASCEKHGGEWLRGGLAGRHSCVLPAPDAGKACTDSKQCTYRCFAQSGDNPAIGQAATGQCQANSSPFGCRTEIIDGKAQPTLCVD